MLFNREEFLKMKWIKELWPRLAKAIVTGDNPSSPDLVKCSETTIEHARPTLEWNLQYSIIIALRPKCIQKSA
jgi:hypothetical protein